MIAALTITIQDSNRIKILTGPVSPATGGQASRRAEAGPSEPGQQERRKELADNAADVGGRHRYSAP